MKTYSAGNLPPRVFSTSRKIFPLSLKRSLYLENKACSHKIFSMDG
jgi:hypothetical protein